MQQYGNTTTFNLESVLLQNIKNSHFYIKKALDLDNVHELIDEIYETVDHVEPWLSGNARGPSSAFCLLYRLGQLKPSPPDLREMLDHKDSPYIRALGLLYLRFCADPRDLWKWFRRYVKDSEVRIWLMDCFLYVFMH
jgi:pre-mRNA-splicing factor 38B